jgi:hypothetical protein
MSTEFQQNEREGNGGLPTTPVTGGGAPPTGGTRQPPRETNPNPNKEDETVENSILSIQLKSNIPNPVVYIDGERASFSIPHTLRFSSDTFGTKRRIRVQNNNISYDAEYEIELGQTSRVGGIWYASWIVRRIDDTSSVESVFEGSTPTTEIYFRGSPISFNPPNERKCLEYRVNPLPNKSGAIPSVDVEFLNCSGEPVHQQIPPLGWTIYAMEGSVEVVGGGSARVFHVTDILEGSDPLVVDEENDEIRDIQNMKPVTFHIEGGERSVVMTYGLSQRILQDGWSTLAEVGSKFSIQSINVNNIKRARYLITQIRVESETSEPAVFTANPNESLELEFTTPSSLNIFITVERLSEILTPVMRLEGDGVLSYNINSPDPLQFKIWTKGVTEYTLSIANTHVSKDTVDGYTTITIPQHIFNEVGQYKLYIVGRGQFSDAQPLDLVVNSFAGEYTDIPAITSVRYPVRIKGPDFVGNDVDFTISWEGEAITNTHVYFGTSTDYHLDIAGGVNETTMKISDILNKFNSGDITDRYVERLDEHGIQFNLKLVPFNKAGMQITEGESVNVPIFFSAGKYTLDRATILSNISKSVEPTLDSSVFDVETSKILTHLLHLDNGISIPISNWAADTRGLILKLYEPIPTEFGKNTLGWISKIQSNPIIETVTLIGSSSTFTDNLRGPNFSLAPTTNIGLMEYDKLVGTDVTSDAVIRKYLQSKGVDIKGLNIRYGKYTPTNEIDVIYYDNFIHFASAAELLHNFVYKLQQIEHYETQISSLVQGNAPAIDLKLLHITENINNIKISFSGYENFLYADARLFNNGDLISTKSEEFDNWYNLILTQSVDFDTNNVNYLVNNIPKYIVKDHNNKDFILFLDMIGAYFDILWAYIKVLTRLKTVTHNKYESVPDKLVYHMLQSFGWDAERPFDTVMLWKQFFGNKVVDSEGNDVSSGIPIEDATNEVWRRILNNLPYLLKHKGTERSIRAIMSCYGVPSSLLSIMEFGGPTEYVDGGLQRWTFDDRTASIVLTNSSHINVPWKSISGEYPLAIELRIKPENTGNVNVLSGDHWTLEIIPTESKRGRLRFTYNGNSVDSNEFPIYNGEYTHIFINVLEPSTIRITAILQDGQSVLSDITFELTGMNLANWSVGNNIRVADTYVGNLDEFRLWRVPFEASSTMLNHALFPDAIDGNTLTSSTEDLYFRLDFEWPKNRATDPNIKNVAISTIYNEPFAQAVGFPNITQYPYNYQPYERTVTARIPKTGFTVSNKVRIEEMQLIQPLTHLHRSTVKAFDRAPVDSNRLGVFFSPIRELNMDIIKTFGDFHIDDYIGDPKDLEREEYTGLKTLRNYYFNRITLNVNEYINLIKYIDKSLFDTILKLVPARANVASGLLIEPHLLERSKVKWTHPTATSKYHETVIDAHTLVVTKMFFLRLQGNVLVGATVNTKAWVSDNLGVINAYSIRSEGDTQSLLSLIRYDNVKLMISISQLSGVATHEWRTAFLAELESNTLVQTGMDYSSYDMAGCGLNFDENSIAKIQQYDDAGGLLYHTKSTQLTSNDYKLKVWIKTVTKNLQTLNDGNTPTIQTVDRSIIFTPTTVGNSIPQTTNGAYSTTYTLAHTVYSSGYFPNHHKFRSSRSTGMENSFFNGAKQTILTTVDGLPPVQTFDTNPNILRVADTGRGSNEPILKVE